MRNSELSKSVNAAGRILLAFLFLFSQSAWAGQDQRTKDKANSTQQTTAPRPGEKQSSAAPIAKAQTKEVQGEASETAVAREKSSRDGAHEGIQVHGHWTIEVHNPDGSLARQIEFENSLDPGFSAPNPAAGQPPLVIPGGAAYLSAVLSGQWSAPVKSDFWAIALVGPLGLSGLTDPVATNAPCVVSQGTSQLDACLIGTTQFCTTGVAGTSCNLSVTPLGTTPQFTGIQLSGSVQATLNGQISTVATLIGGLSCVVTSTPSCLPSTVNTASFTSSTNFPGAPISVIAGQTVAVTVNISFS